MSRNLCATVCVHCQHPVKVIEYPRPFKDEESHGHFKEFEGMLVAKAECPVCFASYLAWLDTTTCVNPVHKNHGEKALPGDVIDLSYLSTFNDEPREDDLPIYNVEKTTVWIRTGKFSKNS